MEADILIRNQRGVTLIELMTVIAIVGILSALALPAFVQVVADGRVRTAASDLSTELAYARVEAVKRSSRVGLGRTGSDWQAGWVMFVDANRNGVMDVAEKAAALKVQSALTDPLKVCTVGASVDVLEFGADGRMRAFDGGALKPATTAIKVSSSNASTARRARELVFSPSGRLSMNTGAAVTECS